MDLPAPASSTPLLSGEPPFRVLLVDDEPLQWTLVQEILAGPGFEVEIAADGLQGLACLGRADFDVVLTDRRMPGMDGDEFCRRVRRQPGLAMLPILMVTGSTASSDLQAGLSAGADDFLGKPYNPVELLARVRVAAQRKRAMDQLDSTESTLFALARMVEAKDENTGDHCSRLAHKAVGFGRALGLSTPELHALRRGGVLHDIGKLGIPDHILLKPGALTDEEWTVMRQHTTIGYHLVSNLRSMRLTAPIIRHHHERWDGSGYPDRLAGDAIPLLARVFQIVDIHDALTYERPYKKALSEAQARSNLEDETARGWRDPALIRAFFEWIDGNPAWAEPPAQPADDLGIQLYTSLSSAG